MKINLLKRFQNTSDKPFSEFVKNRLKAIMLTLGTQLIHTQKTWSSGVFPVLWAEAEGHGESNSRREFRP